MPLGSLEAGGHGIRPPGLWPCSAHADRGFHYDRGSSRWQSCACHSTGMGGQGKESQSLLPGTIWLAQYSSKEVSLNYKAVAPKVIWPSPLPLAGGLWFRQPQNSTVASSLPAFYKPPSEATPPPRGHSPTPCDLAHGPVSVPREGQALPGGGGRRHSTYTLPYSISVMVMVLTCHTSSLLGINRSSLARWPTQREAMSPK